ncbi:MAG: CPBP family intramembrane metalloprotease [Prevotellaceae bacterium]|jgi:membrane protease YdiL (CAAX protease family)|nr:CPBP family intramembrane metalloprotease [Prevotellaceae bacterium]
MNKSFASPLAQMLILIVCILGSVIAVWCAATFLTPAFGITSSEFLYGSPTFNPTLTRYHLAVQSIALFLLPTLIASRVITSKPLVYLGLKRKPLSINVFNSIFLMLFSMPFISYAAEANAQIPLPEWATNMEKSASELTAKILLTNSTGGFIANLFTVALLPALSEELFFRGFLQNLARRLLKNPHVAIFTTAFIFSAFHLQFSGFIPRLLLGVGLGYLYHWSGSLWLPTAAHFTNNAAICVYYFYISVKNTPINAQDIEAAMQGGAMVALLSLMLVVITLRRIFTTEKMHKRIQRLRRLTKL